MISQNTPVSAQLPTLIIMMFDLFVSFLIPKISLTYLHTVQGNGKLKNSIVDT